jgi:hypothetical protein
MLILHGEIGVSGLVLMTAYRADLLRYFGPDFELIPDHFVMQ